MAITPGPGYKVDPNNSNAVVPIGSTATLNNPNAGIIAPTATPTNTTITHTSSAPAPTPQPTPQSTYTGPVNNSINNTSQGNALVNSNQQQAAAMGITIPGVGGGSTTPTQPPSPQQQTQQAPQTFSGLIGSLAQNSTTGSPIAGQAAQGLMNSANSNPLTSGAAYDTYSKAVSDYNKLKQNIAQATGNIENDPIGVTYQEGRKAVLARQYAAQLDAAQQAVTQAQAALGYGIQEQGQQQTGFTSAGNLGNTAQGLLQSGLTSAVNAAAPSGSFPFSYDPLTGTFKNASNGQSVQSGLTFNPSQDATTLAAAVMSGQLGYNDALSALGYAKDTADGYLTTAILAKGGNPNTLKAQAAANTANVTQTGTVGGQLSKSAESANQALDKLASDYGNLSWWQSKGFPITNDIAQTLGSALGSSGVSSYQTTLNDARAQLSGVLTATGAVTPTGAGDMARSYLPDGMTPPQLAEKIKAAKALIAQKVQSFTTSNATGGASSSSGGTVSAGGYQFKQVNGQWVPA